MPRKYTVPMPPVAVTAAQDLWQITGAAGKTLKILRVVVSDTDTTLPTAQMVSVRGRFLPATVTPGTGGTSATIAKADPGDAAASFTALLNNTSKATTSSTAVITLEDGFHVYAGYDKSLTAPPIVGPSEAWVFELLSTVTPTVTISGWIEVEETGG